MTTARAAPALAAFLATLLLMPWAARADREGMTEEQVGALFHRSRGVP